MEIRIYPDPILRQKAIPVEDINDEIIQIGNDMMWKMRESRGIGLAAQQVGLLHRIIVIDTSLVDLANGFKGVLINPVILSKSSNEVTSIEGCLSFPNQKELVNRAFSVKVRFVDESNKPQTKIFTGITARCFLHEFDHLEGILFVDYEKEKK